MRNALKHDVWGAIVTLARQPTSDEIETPQEREADRLIDAVIRAARAVIDRGGKTDA